MATLIIRRCPALIRRCTTVLPNVLCKSNRRSTIAGQYNHIFRSTSTCPPIEDFLDLKVEQKDDETYLEAVPISTGREGVLIEKKSEACALCRLNLSNIEYTDVMILSQFIKRDGSLATYYESKLCRQQYKKICGLISRAQRCKLLPRPADYLVPGPWHELNTYLEADRKRDQPMKVIKKQYWKV